MRDPYGICGTEHVLKVPVGLDTPLVTEETSMALLIVGRHACASIQNWWYVEIQNQ